VGRWGPCCLIQISDSSRSISREKVLQKNTARLNQEVMTDGLTRALSRGFFDQFYQQEFARAARQHTKLSLIMLDVDFFKNYNDEYGHPAGDKALIAVVQAVNAALLRATDKLFRYGGEEFVVLLPDCTQEKAMQIAEQLRLAVLALQLSHRMSRIAHQLTVSLGVSTMVSSQTCSAEKLLEAADLALYAAKKHGRNCVRYCSPALTQLPETA
jgi:diguanylate cyclase (GGDEF)-like protein